MLSENITNEFHHIVIELFALNRLEIPSAIEYFEKESKVLKGNAFYSKLIKTVPFHQTGCNLMPDRKDAIFTHCKEKLNEGSNFEKVPNKLQQTVLPKHMFKDFDLIKSVMQDHTIITPEGVSLLNGKAAWKISALIEVIVFFGDKVCKGKFSQNQMRATLNTFLNTKFTSAGKKSSVEYSDLTAGIKTTIAGHLAKKAPML